jgi:hypothetical protein
LFAFRHGRVRFALLVQHRFRRILLHELLSNSIINSRQRIYLLIRDQRHLQLLYHNPYSIPYTAIPKQQTASCAFNL